MEFVPETGHDKPEENAWKSHNSDSRLQGLELRGKVEMVSANVLGKKLAISVLGGLTVKLCTEIRPQSFGLSSKPSLYIPGSVGGRLYVESRTSHRLIFHDYGLLLFIRRIHKRMYSGLYRVSRLHCSLPVSDFYTVKPSRKRVSFLVFGSPMPYKPRVNPPSDVWRGNAWFTRSHSLNLPFLSPTILPSMSLSLPS